LTSSYVSHVQVVDKFYVKDRTVIIMPLLAATVSKYVQASGLAAAVDDMCAGILCMCVLAAVACLAALNWCHGDIKPDNILLSGEKVSCL
jgi:serine/threonine protein kinase